MTSSADPPVTPSRLARGFAVLLGLVVLATLWIAAIAHQLSARSRRVCAAYAAVQNARCELLRIDLELHAAVRLAAATGDPVWQQRYDATLPRLAQLLQQTLDDAYEPIDEVSAWRTSDGNERMLEIEQDALAAAHAGDLGAARALVASPEYASLRRDYQSRVDDLHRRLVAQHDRELERIRARSILAIAIAAVAVAGLAVLGLLLRRSLRATVAASAQARLLAELNTALESARAEALAANQAKSAFLASISHELRTPLTAVLGFAELLAGSAQDEEDREAIGMIQRNGQHLLSLLNDVLDFSKVEAGKIDLQRERVHPLEVLHEIEAMLTIQARERGVELLFEWAGPVPESIETDRLRLRQILTNLAGNAIKFSEQGCEVHVLATIASSGTGDARLAVEVIDSGIGISEEQLARLFQPFVQVAAGPEKRFGGTGLGLVISQRLARLLGGEITVRSEIGKGSIFRLELPVGPIAGIRMSDAGEGPAGSAAALHPPAPELSGRILVVEDIEANQRLIARILRRAGAEVVLAAHGQQALAEYDAATAAGRPFDLVLMDMQMPVMDGFTATRHLKQRAPALPVIALTAGVTREDVDRTREVGCDDFAPKPIRSHDLIALVRRNLDAVRRVAPAAGGRV
jgi:signal transduction histidine kinase/ActR/RegA family two-component response regulator